MGYFILCIDVFSLPETFWLPEPLVFPALLKACIKYFGLVLASSEYHATVARKSEFRTHLQPLLIKNTQILLAYFMAVTNRSNY